LPKETELTCYLLILDKYLSKYVSNITVAFQSSSNDEVHKISLKNKRPKCRKPAKVSYCLFHKILWFWMVRINFLENRLAVKPFARVLTNSLSNKINFREKRQFKTIEKETLVVF